MTTYINKIVQVTREMNGQTGSAYDGLLARRGDLILQALRDPATGIDGPMLADTIRWAIGVNDLSA